jgi:hypothetical protein
MAIKKTLTECLGDEYMKLIYSLLAWKSTFKTLSNLESDELYA